MKGGDKADKPVSSTQPEPDLKRKSILKAAGSVAKPDGRVNWGQLFVKVQLPSPDGSDPSPSLPSFAAGKRVGRPDREKYYTIGIDKREELKQKDKKPTLMQVLDLMSPEEEAKIVGVVHSQPEKPIVMEPLPSKRSGSADELLLANHSAQRSEASFGPEPVLKPPPPETTIAAPIQLAKKEDDDEIMMTPISKSAKFQFVKSPADFPQTKAREEKPAQMRLPRLTSLKKGPAAERAGEVASAFPVEPEHCQAENAIRNYLYERKAGLDTLLARYSSLRDRVASKRTQLNALIQAGSNGLTKMVQIPGGLEKTKLEICQHPAYVDMVNYYTFMLSRLGWRIPVASMFIHFPYLDFLVNPPHQTILRLQLSKKEVLVSGPPPTAGTIFQKNYSVLKMTIIPKEELLASCPFILALPEREAYLKLLTESLSKELTSELALMNRMHLGQLGLMLSETVSKISQLKRYFRTLATISQSYVLSGEHIDSEKGIAEYTVTLWSARKLLVTSYVVKAPILELWKIAEIVPLYLKSTSEGEDIETVRQDFEDTVRDNMRLVKAGRMELHDKFSEFAEKFLTYYEDQLFGSTGGNQLAR